MEDPPWKQLEETRERLDNRNREANMMRSTRRYDGMKFLIFSRKNAKDQNLINDMIDEPHIWISIYTPGDKEATLAAESGNSHFIASHRVAFHDLTFESASEADEPITDKQAQDIVDFVHEYKDKVGLICVHCDAGVSRSSGTALALSELINGHDSGIRGCRAYSPNPDVKATIVRMGEKLATDKTPVWYREYWK